MNKILLDTHMILWNLANDIRLTDKTKALILDPKNKIYCSVASFWEIEIKHLIHPDLIPQAEEIIKYCRQAGYETLVISPLEVINLSSLKTESKHKDPFDRLLISQAKTYGMNLLTADSLLTSYDETCIIEA